jgi:hypothetical protein
MRLLLSILLLNFITSCNVYDRKQEVFMADKDFVEFDRQLSPDSSILLLNYGIDLGALGYGQAGTAILRLNDTTGNLRQLSLPNSLTDLKWIDNRTVSAKYDILPSTRMGQRHDVKDTVVNNVKVIVAAYDHIEPGSHLYVENREVSPNGKYELVAYRYIKDVDNLNLIHVSIIPKGSEIPKYGNYLIADKQSDYVLGGVWSKDNNLIFFSNGLYADMIQYYLVHNRPRIEYQVVKDEDKYGGKYRWRHNSENLH